MGNRRIQRTDSLLRRDLLRATSVLAAAGGVGTPLAQAAESEENSLPFIVSPGYAEVETTSGKVQGFTERGIFTYLGIPYGAPTGGEARFQPPTKPEPRTHRGADAWLALDYGPICPQVEGRPHPLSGFFYDEGYWLMDEDCLYLNVWTSGINDRGERPVLVWLHEAGFFGGSGHQRRAYYGRNLAERGDVVVVSLNHRLNAFGFLNLAGYGEKYASSVNVGMLDIVAALEWVRDNIGGFGGDPRNVTIFGQSGGGGKVNHLMAMPSAKGLFHKAVAQSPAPLITHEYTMEQAAGFADAVIGRLGLSRVNIDRIHEAPHQDIFRAYYEAMEEDRNAWIGPVVDGAILPEIPFDTSAPAISADIPLMVGTTMRESGPILGPNGESMTEPELLDRVKQKHGNRSTEILAVFRKTFPGVKPVDLWHLIDRLGENRETAVLQAARKAEQSAAPAYLYQFAWETPVLDGLPRAFHGSEVAFVFCNTDRCERMTGGTDEARAVAANVSDAWIHFARTGNPNHPGLPEWPAFTPDFEPTMIFDTRCEVRHNYDREAREMLKQG